jgi:POT family proton-dependent oligopeptide transporter
MIISPQAHAAGSGDLMDIVWLVGIVVTVATAVPVLLQLRGHPRGLFVLFFAEMWERFSYYGMRGLLIFYLTEQFLLDDKFSSGQYGAYTALVYLLPLIGGFAADQFLGTRKAIAFGALLLVAGHFTMAVEARPAVQTLSFAGQTYSFRAAGRMEARKVCLEVGPGCYPVSAATDGGMKIAGLPASAPLPQVLPKGGYQLGVAQRNSVFVGIFYLALSLIIMGVGFLKANISSIVGQLYRQGDPRRDPGFTLYYYGINLGAFWAAILCGWLGTNIGWWAGFGAAGVGMLAGYLVFVLGKPLLEGHGEPPAPAQLKAPLLGPINAEWSLYLAGLAGVGVVWLIVQRFQLIGYMLGAGSLVVLGYLGWFMAAKCTRIERDRMILALILIAASVIFWTMFEQAGSSLNQFADRNTQLQLTATQSITAPQIQSFNAGFILIGAPVFAALWAFLGRRRADPNPAIKFALGLMQVGLSFLIIVLGSRFADASFREPLVFLAMAYVVQTTGELCLSPVGLSQMTKLSPPLLLSTVMATWFLASSWAQWLGGFVAQLTAAETVAGQVLDPAKALATYVHVYAAAGWITFGLGVALAAASPFLKRLAHGASDITFAPELDGERQAVASTPAA